MLKSFKTIHKSESSPRHFLKTSLNLGKETLQQGHLKVWKMLSIYQINVEEMLFSNGILIQSVQFLRTKPNRREIAHQHSTLTIPMSFQLQVCSGISRLRKILSTNLTKISLPLRYSKWVFSGSKIIVEKWNHLKTLFFRQLLNTSIKTRLNLTT